MQNIAVGETKLTESEIDAAVSVLRSGALRQGKVCKAFEEEFAENVGAQHAVTCSSGSAALHLAYMCFLEAGDEVLVPSFTFFATGGMVSMAGGNPVFCEIDPVSFLIDLDDAEKKITDKTRAISPVHLYGNPCNIDLVRQFADKHNLKIVWDAAQAHGACFNGNDIGSYGEFVCYSFYPSKNMFVGEGGMVCTDNADYADMLNYKRMHGQSGKYYHTMLGLNYRMTDVEAAIGREQLKRLDQMLEIRTRNAEHLNSGLADVNGIRTPSVNNGGKHAWHQYCIVVDKGAYGIDRDSLIEKMKNKGVMTAIHYPRGMHQQPVFEDMYGKHELPVTERMATEILALPVHHGLTEKEIDYIVDVIRE